MRRILPLLLLLSGCSSVEDKVQQLAAPRVDLEILRQELLLIGEEAVPPLLAALDGGRHPAPRELVEVLVRFMVRLDKPEIEAALINHLGTHPLPAVRADLARGLGMHHRTAAVDALLDALDDADADVRFESLFALSQMASAFDDAQHDRAKRAIKPFLADAERHVRIEAGVFEDQIVNRWLEKARAHDLRAEAFAADSLYGEALAYAPEHMRANYLCGMFYYLNGREDEGLGMLRRRGLALDVPRLAAAPALDGRLDDRVWQQARSFPVSYMYTDVHQAALPSDKETETYVYYTDEAIYIGIRAMDARPDSLMVNTYDPLKRKTSADWNEDFVELFFDFDFDRQGHSCLSINSKPIVAAQHEDYSEGYEFTPWLEGHRAAVHIGGDFWSFEYELRFGGDEVGRPAKGDIWGFNVGRMFRASHYSLWVRTNYTTHDASQYGLLVFD